MPARITSAAVIGLNAQPIEVEVDLYSGLHSFHIVGLPDKAVGESRERVSSALLHSGAKPASRFNKRITVNLAPADIKKEGSLYDLPIAVGFLLASGQSLFSPDQKMFVGELSLDGRVRPVNGILAIALLAKEKNMKEFFVPLGNAQEAALVRGLSVIGVSSLAELIAHLEGNRLIEPAKNDPLPENAPEPTGTNMHEIKGQEHAKRAMEVAAAGGHNILLGGPPGGGKTLLAKTLPSILPRMEFDEALEVTKIFSIAGLLSKNNPFVGIRPFRSPHHTASQAALIGGGSYPRPGEVSLAHRGVLFIDEFPELHRDLIEGLRQPLEDGVVTISRTQGTVPFPARFMLVAAYNPCPCGFWGDSQKNCVCSPANVSRYRRKLSGPILDRIDIHVEVPRVPQEKLMDENETGEPSEAIRRRVEKARAIQRERFQNEGIYTNSEMTIPLIKRYCALDAASRELLKNAVVRLGISARAYHKILKLSRTIADLAGSSSIQPSHVAEAVQYRHRQEE